MKSRPPFESLYIYLLLALVGYFTADLGLLYVRDQMIPKQAPPARPPKLNDVHGPKQFDYRMILTRNLFNPDGKIPEPFGSGAEDRDEAQPDAPPVPSLLPLMLVGTLVHFDPERSIVTLTIKSKNENHAFSVGDEIEGLAKIEKIFRDRVVIRNASNSRLEYLELKREGTKLNFGAKPTLALGDVLAKDEFDREMKRSDLEKYLSNLPEVLQQATLRPVENNGRIEGFRFVDIQANSIYEKLGFKRGDVLKSVNGDPIDSAAKGMEMYQALRSADGLKMQIDRNGRLETLNYTIRK